MVDQANPRGNRFAGGRAVFLDLADCDPAFLTQRKRANQTHVRPQHRLRPGRGHAAARRRGRGAMRDEALAAIAAATDLDELKEVRLAHAGDRSPLALPTARSAPCRRRRARRPGSGSVRPAVPSTRRSSGVPRSSRPSTRSGCWSTRPSTSRCPTTATRKGARHPLTTLMRADQRRLRGDGLGGRRGPRGRGRVAQLRRPQPRQGPPGPHRCRTRSSSSPRTQAWCSAPTPHRSRRAAC